MNCLHHGYVTGKKYVCLMIKRLYFENSNESESSGDEGSAKTISRTDILENMTEQELMDEYRKPNVYDGFFKRSRLRK